MKRVVLFILSVFLLLNFSACTKQNSIVTEDCDNQKGCDISEGGEEIKTLDFKESYESLNNHETKSGKIYREIHLDNTNSFKLLDLSDFDMSTRNIEFTGILFISDPKCPWCRSIIETAVKVANEMNVQNIYTVHAWDADGNELFRDKWVPQGESYVLEEGHPFYNLLINSKGNELLQDYIVTRDDGSSFQTGEKRIYLPSFLYVEDNEIKAFTTGVSELQKDAYEELTDAMLKDTETQLKEFFSKVR